MYRVMLEKLNRENLSGKHKTGTSSLEHDMVIPLSGNMINVFFNLI